MQLGRQESFSLPEVRRRGCSRLGSAANGSAMILHRQYDGLVLFDPLPIVQGGGHHCETLIAQLDHAMLLLM